MQQQMHISYFIFHVAWSDEIDSSISKNTARAYKSDWSDFVKFCKYKKYQSLPSKYETIGEYLDGEGGETPNSFS